MAQVDTGLGWSGASEYLVSSNAILASFGGILSWTLSGWEPNHLPVIPETPSAADLMTRGILWASIYNDDQTRHRELYAASDSPGTIMFLSVATGNAHAWRGYALGRENAKVWIMDVADGVPGTVAELSMSGYSISPNIYFTQTVRASGTWNYNLGTYSVPRHDVSNLNDQSGMLNWALENSAISTPVPINKLNVGYSAACIAIYNTVSGLRTTPVLISSERNLVQYSYTGTYSEQETSHLLDGMRFYMRVITNITDPLASSAVPVIDLSSGPIVTSDVLFRGICGPSYANILVTETFDPYEGFGHTGEDAGEINPDPDDDDIDFDDLPTKSFATAGFCRIFNPDASDLNALASYMWTDQTFLQTVINHLKQILENPIEAIISLSMVPVQPPRGSTKVPVNVMYVNTGVSMYPVNNQFVEVDCGTLTLQECYGGALDYNPYTRVQIYLPYIGIVQLDTDEVMAKTLHLKYNIDVVTGICCAEIKADNKLLYSFSGHCAVSQPITSADFSSYLNAAIAAAKVAVGVATGMASTTAGAAAAELPPAVPSKPQTSSALVPLPSSGAIGPHLGSPAMSSSRGWTDFSDIPEPQSNGGASWGELAKPGNANTVASAMGGKMVVQHSGGFSGNSGYLAKRRPYLIIIRPRIANPENYAQHFGRTSMEYLNLGSCTGYTKVQSVHLSGFDATNPELSEISSLLKGGVLM